MNYLFRILLTLNATFLLIIIYFVKNNITINDYLKYKNIEFQPSPLFSFFLYMLIPLILTWLSIFLSKFLPKNSFKKEEIKSISHANNSFLPSYLGYFFVALSIDNTNTLIFVYTILFVFTFLSQALYFNPLFLIYGYDFYNIETKNGAGIFLISKESYKKPTDVEISSASRINNYTFIE